MLVHVNSTNHKALILLCGSAGDGKSHLLSYLGNADSEHLLNSFELYNDATESSAPSLTSIDTLAVKLSAFDDQHILEDDGSRMVLAINLGTLNNFIESEKGGNFSLLKKYVEENEIFSSYVRPNAYQEGSVFQHVSFSDYQIFTLCEDGVRTTYLEELLNKIFDQSQGNPFFKAYQTNSTCTLCQKCPLRHNFEFLFNPVHRKGIINKIVEVVIKDKAIVSTRDVLNLVYDLLVHPEFSYETFCHVGTSETQYLTEYIRCTTPVSYTHLVPISELSKETGLATTTLTSMLDRMEAANLIYRDRGDKDRRKILIFLTEEAKGLEQEYNEVTEEISNIYYKGFSEAEIEQLENYLHRILKNVEDVL